MDKKDETKNEDLDENSDQSENETLSENSNQNAKNDAKKELPKKENNVEIDSKESKNNKEDDKKSKVKSSKKVDNVKENKKHPILKFILILIIVLLVMLIAFSIFYYFYNKNQAKIDEEQNQKLSQILKEENKEFEYGSEISFNDLKNSVIDTSKLDSQTSFQIEINDNVKSDEENYKFMQVGENKIKTTVKSKDESKKVLIINTDNTSIKNFFQNFKITYEPKEYSCSKVNTYNVVDTQKPTIDGVSDKEIYVGTDIDLKQGIKATDPVDGDLEINIDGAVDKNKAGEYKIKVSAKDKNNNETTKEFKVTVKEKPKPQVAVVKSTTSAKSSSSKGAANQSSSSSKSNSSNRRYSSYIINKYYKNCTDDQIDEAEAIARSIASSAKSSSSEPLDQINSAAKQVYNYWIKCSYDYSYANPYYRSPYGVFCAKVCTCSGITRALGRVLDHMGYQWKHVNENQYDHQWNEVTVNGQTIWADGMAGVAGTGEHPEYFILQ